MFPAKGKDVGEEIIRYYFSLFSECSQYTVQIDMIPQDNSSGDQIQPRGAELHIFPGTIPKFSIPVEENGAC